MGTSKVKVIKSFIPNLLTLSNLMCGSVAIWFAFNSRLDMAAYLMFVAAVLDFLDGFVARLLKVSGELGKQLDSLADVITFGLLPGFIAYFIIQTLSAAIVLPSFLRWIIDLWPLLIPAFSAFRLARFNIDTRQAHGFIGLPTPANAILWAVAGWMMASKNYFIQNQGFWLIVFLVLVLVLSFLLVSELRMFALKFSNFSLKDNKIRYLILAVSLVLIVLGGIKGLGLSILLYILVSLFYQEKQH